MTSKLSRYCDGLMEAAWLAAAILVPIFFNIYSSRIFEPDKIAILRSLALLILGAWLVKLVDQSGMRWEQLQPGAQPLKFITKIPLLLPVSGLVVLYIISTIFSVSPRVSFLGSYQRLQGTYTTFSYVVVFLSMLGNLRKRAQVERLITTIILTSLPVALYGVLQRYKIDPVPWGGDTSVRIASNMGNSIFVAAYIIMVFPLVVGRIVQAFSAILKDEGQIWPQVARATIYVFIASIQLIALYMSGSRGPALGWMAGSFFLFLLLSLYWNKRWLTLATVGAAVAIAIFLVVFNIPNGPLQALRSSPAVGRFGLLLDAQSNSALVRKYIWQGAAELVSPHDPLQYPDGRSDVFNFLRLAIGYGPESMYVAYNPFYVPELALVEKRNASPDRSHNETWDALVITGVLGILVYLALFTLVFYYGLKWTGLVTSKKLRNLFLILVLSAGGVGAVGLGLWRGWEYFGVGLPLGMLIGLLIYITLIAVYQAPPAPATSGEAARALTMIVLIAAIVSHFVEINFGIAIAVTRTYFWTYAALMVTVGYLLPLHHEYSDSRSNAFQPTAAATLLDSKRSTPNPPKKKRVVKSSAQDAFTAKIFKYKESIVAGLLIGILLSAVGYDFITNPRGLKSGLDLIWTSFTSLPNRNFAVSYGVLGMILTTWIFMAVVYASETTRHPGLSWWKRFAVTSSVSGMAALLFWLWHAGTLAAMARISATNLEQVLAQVGRYEGLPAGFYIYGFGLLLTTAHFLPDDSPMRQGSASAWAKLTAAGSLLFLILLAAFTNLRIVQADIVFKLAEPFTRSGQWPVAIAIYDRANDLAPNEDYYYLFLGRAYLEHSKTLSDPQERDAFIGRAELDLRLAQSINPLNTDHTANLARLYSLWGSYTSSDEQRNQKGKISEEYFSNALRLSPNSARLWDEWALLYLNVLEQNEPALEKLNQALAIDPKYHWTWALMGEYYNRIAHNATEPQNKAQAFEKAAENFKAAIDLPTPGEPYAHYNYSLALAGVYTQLEQVSSAIDTYQSALGIAPAGAETWRVEEAIAGLFSKIGDQPNALIHIQNAYNLAPEDQKERLQALIDQLQQSVP